MNTTSSTKSQRLPTLTRYLVSHARALLGAVGSITQKPYSSLLSIIIIGIAISLPACLHVFLQGMALSSSSFQTTPTISLYLSSNTSTTSAQRLIKQINSFKQVSSSKFISSSQGLKDFAEQTKLQGVLQHMQHNPLPAIIEVTPVKQQQNPKAMHTLQVQLQNITGVKMAQLDTKWVSRLYNIVLLGKRISLILTVLFYAAVILIVSNIIRAHAQFAAQESTILHLFGASKSMIKRPLLYRGLILGLSGGLTSIIIVLFSVSYIKKPLLELSYSYKNPILLAHLSLHNCITILLASAILGWLGASLASYQHLNRN